MSKQLSEYFLRIADVTATRATCHRLHVGAVVVVDRNILATGYNGSVRGLPHCDDVGCMMVDSHCLRTVHAEANAIAQAAKHGARINGATLYVTHHPCWPCLKLAINAGVKEVIFAHIYGERNGHHEEMKRWAREAGVELYQHAMGRAHVR